MDMTYYIDQIKFQLTGDVLESEMDDESYMKVINIALQELNRYYDSTKLVTTKASRCIDLAEIENTEGIKINHIAQVYRTRPGASSSDAGSTTSDPMFISQWNLSNNFYSYGSNNWALNYMAYNTMNQLANTMSTDLDFKVSDKKLYVSYSNGTPDELTIEYVPKLETVEEVTGDYWINILLKLSLAYGKITLGRIRSRYTQNDALWSQDGDKILAEGREELKDLCDRLKAQANFSYPLD